MNIGRLDKRVTIQSGTTMKDVYGQPLETWSDIATVWASIQYIGGREKLRSGVVDANLDVTVAVRYYEQLTPPKDSDGWRIVTLPEREQGIYQSWVQETCKKSADLSFLIAKTEARCNLERSKN